jgi:hypothetical protein
MHRLFAFLYSDITTRGDRNDDDSDGDANDMGEMNAADGVGGMDDFG